jgi:hypothetical protein
MPREMRKCDKRENETPLPEALNFQLTLLLLRSNLCAVENSIIILSVRKVRSCSKKGKMKLQVALIYFGSHFCSAV